MPFQGIIKSASTCKNCKVKLRADNIVFHGIYQINKCRDCYNEYHKQYRLKNKDRIKTYESRNKDAIKNNNLRREYGISLELYKKQEALQLNGCAICKNPCGSGYDLSVDHNHKTDEFRGLLCKKCNLALGAFNDNEDLLLNAIEYLKRTTWRKVG